MRHIAAFALLLIPTPLTFGQDMNTLTAKEKTEGWKLLFDGKGLSGWHPEMPAAGRGGGKAKAAAAAPAPPAPGDLPQQGSNPPRCVTAGGRGAAVPAGASQWEVTNGLLTPCGENAGYLNSDQGYKNFVLSVEFRCGELVNSGVFVRSPQENGGYEVQIWKKQPAGYNTGGIVGTAKTAREFNFKPDEWNRYEITANGDRLIVVLNGQTTVDVHDAKFPDGNFRLQYQKFPIAFRNIKVRPLP